MTKDAGSETVAIPGKVYRMGRRMLSGKRVRAISQRRKDKCLG